MRKPVLAASLALVVWPIVEGLAQNSGTTTLVLRVGPEARVDPQQVPLSFVVSTDGTADVTTVPVQITARVRALAGQAIRVTGQLKNLQGPSGPVDAGAVRWAGSVVNATGAARQAACSSGAFASGASENLVAGWQTSGLLVCALNFQLTQPRSFPPGAYSGTVQLAVATQ